MIICVSTYTDRPWKDSEGFFYITSPEVLLHLVNEYFEIVKSFLRENNVYDDILDDLLYADDVILLVAARTNSFKNSQLISEKMLTRWMLT